jgi:hypothetical protein
MLYRAQPKSSWKYSAIWPHEEVCFPVALCVRAGGRCRGRWRPLDAARAVADVGGVPAVVVIRHGLLVAAAGVPDGHLVVPWVPGGGAG